MQVPDASLSWSLVVVITKPNVANMNEVSWLATQSVLIAWQV
jgi:hypothetical protein